MLQGHVQVGQDGAFRHERNDLIHLGIGIDIVQAYPCGQLSQGLGEADQAGFHGLAGNEIRAVFQIDAIGAGILGHHQQLAHPCFYQTLGLCNDFMQRAAHQVATQSGDDAELATVVTALGNLEIGIVPGRELDPLGRNQAGPGIMGRRQLFMHQGHDLLVGMRPGNAQYLGIFFPDFIRPRAKTTGDQHPAIGVQGLAYGFQRLLHRGVDEAAGVDDDQVGILVTRHHDISLGAQLGENALGVHQVLWTAQADEADGRRRRFSHEENPSATWPGSDRSPPPCFLPGRSALP